MDGWRDDNEKRGARRLQMKLKATLRQLGGRAQSFDEVTSDLSGGGVFVVTDAPLSTGDRLELELNTQVPNEEPVRLGAEVVRIVHRPERGVALRFLDASASQLFQLALVLTQAEQQTGDLAYGID